MDMRLVIAVAVFLLGSMYLWSSPAFVRPADVRTGAPAWSERFYAPAEATNMWSQGLLRTSLLVVALFAAVAFGIWRGAGTWWVWVALGAAVLAVLVLLPWWFAVGAKAPAASLAVNAVLLLWALALIVVALSPPLREQALRLAGGG